MAASRVVPAHMRAAQALFLEQKIRDDEGIAALRRVLGTRLERVAVIPQDLAMLLQLLAERERADAGEATEEGAAMTSPPRPAAGVRGRILEIWRELLGIREIGPDDNFFELGGHSLLGTSMLSRVRRELGVSLPLRALFEAPTVRTLAERVETLVWAVAGVPARDGAEADREEIEI